jgi:hypothetical protein
MPRSRTQFRLFDLVMWVILAALFFGFFRQIGWMQGRNEGSHGSVVLLGIGFGLWFAVRSTVRAKRSGTVCHECGRRFLAQRQLADSTICPRCRPATLPRVQVRRERTSAFLTTFFFVTCLAALAGLPLWNTVAGQFGGFVWIIYPLLALGATLGFLAAVILVIAVVTIVRNVRMRYEKPSLALARKCSSQEGTIERIAPVTIWWCGAVNPVAMVMEQMGIIRTRFEHLIDESVETPRLRLLVFDTRKAFLAYHRNMVPGRAEIDCLYAGRPVRSITLAMEATRFRVHDHVRAIRAGFVLYFLECYKGFLPPTWLQMGVGGVLATDQAGDARAQLIRRMKVSLANRTALSAAELFQQRRAREVFKQLNAQSEHDPFARFTQFRGQSWSVVEYLAGRDAPPDRLGRFRSFLSDLKATGSQEAVFEHHFGHGFEALLEQWRAWVLEQSAGDDPMPPPEIRTTILDQLVPAIRDPAKKAQDRIQAMRSLGGAGYVLGAHSLIDVLREGDERFIPTAAWALEAISGQPFGSDAQRWAQWWSGRDPSAVTEFELAELP